MAKLLSEKEKEIADLKSQGLKQRDIAKIVYPEAKPAAGEVLISRQLKKPHVAQYVDTGVTKALKKYGITFDLLIAKLVTMLNAERTSNLTGEILPDNQTQLSAIKTLLPLIEKHTEQAQPITNHYELAKAIKDNVDEVKLVEATFRKSHTDN